MNQEGLVYSVMYCKCPCPSAQRPLVRALGKTQVAASNLFPLISTHWFGYSKMRTGMCMQAVKPRNRELARSHDQVIQTEFEVLVKQSFKADAMQYLHELHCRNALLVFVAFHFVAHES